MTPQLSSPSTSDTMASLSLSRATMLAKPSGSSRSGKCTSGQSRGSRHGKHTSEQSGGSHSSVPMKRGHSHDSQGM